jgi:hypothetical protein
MKILTKVVRVKRKIRVYATALFYFIAGGKFDDDSRATNPDKACKIYFGLLNYRIVCKIIYTIACLGVAGCAIALPFVSQLQSFLHLSHFVKLIFENNWHAIAKLTSVAVFSLLCAALYLAQVIVSIKKLNLAVNVAEEFINGGMNEPECEAQHHLSNGRYSTCIYRCIIKEYPDNNLENNCFSAKGILSNM